MEKTYQNKITLMLVGLLAFVLAFAFAFTITSDVASAGTSEWTATDKITVGHISDIHYFPLEYCYQDVSAEGYYDSDFYGSLTGDTKLVMESGNALYKNVKRIIADAQAGVAPMYFVASGDLNKNGERIAHVDVANALRYCQNEVRKIAGYENFQLFVNPGNHDLYNNSGALYDKDTGSAWQAETVSAAQFALIYAGLGFPDADLDGTNGFDLNLFFEDSYWYSNFTGSYIPSKNADNLDFEYLNDSLEYVYSNAETITNNEIIQNYANIGDSNNVLSYAATQSGINFTIFVLDSTDREETHSTTSLTPIRIGYAEYEAYLYDQPFDYYTFDESTKTFEMITGSITSATFDNGPVFRNTCLNHLTGGRLNQECFEFMENIVSQPNNEDNTYISVVHQNALPHFDQEDEILKDFTLYNWEYTVKRLLNMGIHYSLSGHMHSSDIANYVDAEGNVFYEFETGSTVSYDSPMRYLTIQRYYRDGSEGQLAEHAESSMWPLDNLKETPSTNVFNPETVWDTAGDDEARAYADNPTEENLAAALAINPDFYTYIVHYDKMSVDTFNEYIYDAIYGQLIERLLQHFLDADSLKSTVIGLVNNYLGPDSKVLDNLPVVGGILTSYKTHIYKIAMTLVNTLWDGLYGENGYPYNGQTYSDVIEYVKAVARSVIGLSYGDETLGKMTLAQMAVFILTAHNSGLEISTLLTSSEGITDPNNPLYQENSPYNESYRLRFIAAMGDLSNQCDSGKLARDLFGSLLNPLYFNDDSLLKTLLTYHFDFTKGEYGLTSTEVREMNSIIRFVLNVVASIKFDSKTGVATDKDGNVLDISISLDNFVLVDVVDGLLPVLSGILNDSLSVALEGDDTIDAITNLFYSYLTDSFYVGLSGIAKNIIFAFATDDTTDLADIKDPTIPLTITAPYKSYGTISVDGEEIELSYLEGALVTEGLMGATQANGRMPGNLTAAFDTVNGTTEFDLNFYTDEEIFASVSYRKAGDTEWIHAYGESWNIFDPSESDYILDVNDPNYGNLYGEVTSGNVKIETLTSPAYIPLIDLGLLCLTHSATYYEFNDGGDPIEKYYTCLDRSNAPTNSVLYRNRHKVTFSNLEPGTTYQYSITGYTINSRTYCLNEYCGVEAFTFTTAAPSTVDEFEFLAVADPQGMIQSMYDKTSFAFDTINSSSLTNNYDFIINGGDMVDNGKNYYHWQYTLNTMLSTYANTSMFMAAGNHESETKALAKFFNYTQPDSVTTDNYKGGEANEDYYSFNYANALFVVLDTNNLDSKGLAKPQLDWMEATLENSTAKWKFVVMHKSLYSTGSHANDSEVAKMRGQLTPIFEENGVDIVFSGHDHVYAQAPVNGVLYVTLGTIGTKYYDYKNNNADVSAALDYSHSIPYTLDNPTFGYVKVSGDSLVYNGYIIGSDGTITVIEDYAKNKVTNALSGCGDIITIGFFENSTDFAFDNSTLPIGYKYLFVANGNEYGSLSEIIVNSGSVSVNAYIVAPNGERELVKSFIIEKENYVLGVALWTVGAVVVAAAAAISVLMVLKKKKKVCSCDGIDDDDCTCGDDCSCGDGSEGDDCSCGDEKSEEKNENEE